MSSAVEVFPPDFLISCFPGFLVSWFPDSSVDSRVIRGCSFSSLFPDSFICDIRARRAVVPRLRDEGGSSAVEVFAALPPNL
jgi:hypothetical protein